MRQNERKMFRQKGYYNKRLIYWQTTHNCRAINPFARIIYQRINKFPCLQPRSIVYIILLLLFNLTDIYIMHFLDKVYLILWKMKFHLKKDWKTMKKL